MKTPPDGVLHNTRLSTGGALSGAHSLLVDALSWPLSLDASPLLINDDE